MFTVLSHGKRTVSSCHAEGLSLLWIRTVNFFLLQCFRFVICVRMCLCVCVIKSTYSSILHMPLSVFVYVYMCAYACDWKIKCPVRRRPTAFLLFFSYSWTVTLQSKLKVTALMTITASSSFLSSLPSSNDTFSSITTSPVTTIHHTHTHTHAEMHMFHQASLKLGLDRAVLAHARNEQVLCAIIDTVYY